MLLPGRRLRPRPPGFRPEAWRLRAVVALLVGGHRQLLQAANATPGSATLTQWDRALEPWRAVYPYGLFAVMTTERDEVVLEGSADGKNLEGIRLLVGSPEPWARGRRFVAPHLPRLDWQLWFAALGEAGATTPGSWP